MPRIGPKSIPEDSPSSRTWRKSRKTSLSISGNHHPIQSPPLQRSREDIDQFQSYRQGRAHQGVVGVHGNLQEGRALHAPAMDLWNSALPTAALHLAGGLHKLQPRHQHPRLRLHAGRGGMGRPLMRPQQRQKPDPLRQSRGSPVGRIFTLVVVAQTQHAPHVHQCLKIRRGYPTFLQSVPLRIPLSQMEIWLLRCHSPLYEYGTPYPIQIELPFILTNYACLYVFKENLIYFIIG